MGLLVVNVHDLVLIHHLLSFEENILVATRRRKNENKLTFHQLNLSRLNVLIIKLFSLRILCSNLRENKVV
jgi:hypothetical protein